MNRIPFLIISDLKTNLILRSKINFKKLLLNKIKFNKKLMKIKIKIITLMVNN